MMFQPKFDVEVRIAVAVRDMRWPREGPAEYGESANRGYVDLTSVAWEEVDDILSVEASVIDSCMRAANEAEEFRAIFREAEAEFGERADREESDEEFLGAAFLDLGTAAATLALNAAGCPSIMACNGHQTGYPYIAFWARREHVSLLREAAEAAHVGLINGMSGGLEVYSDVADGLVRFAGELIGGRNRLAALSGRSVWRGEGGTRTSWAFQELMEGPPARTPESDA